VPLTAKGQKILRAMTRPPAKGGYGKAKGTRVFYASAAKKTITGVHTKRKGK
jgi:hypothetical protein